MNKSFGKYLDFIKNLSFFRHNDLTANLIFILGICLFFVIAEDLGKEFSVEKNEIDYIIAVSEKYISLSDFTLSITLIFHEISIDNIPDNFKHQDVFMDFKILN